MNNEDNKYWFKPKYIGWGFYPVSIRGWIMTLILIALVCLSAYSNGLFTNQVTYQTASRYLFDIIVLIILFSIIAIPKTKGEVNFKWFGKKVFK